MIYIFEDKADDLISLLFKAGYSEKTASTFIYTNGNGALESYIGVDICVNKEVYFNSPLIETQQDKEFCKNFEKYMPYKVYKY